VLAGIAVANIIASALVMQSEIHSSVQKGLQLALVWLLPLLGAAVVLVVWLMIKNAHCKMLFVPVKIPRGCPVLVPRAT
jgi:hypothetical protein